MLLLQHPSPNPHRQETDGVEPARPWCLFVAAITSAHTHPVQGSPSCTVSETPSPPHP